MTPTERQELIKRIDDALYDLQHGPLVKFPLFEDIQTLVIDALGVDPMPKAERVAAEQKLGTKLVQMVLDGDSPSLFKVARTVAHVFNPESPIGKDRMKKVLWEEQVEVLEFFRRHVDEDWTLAEIHKHLEAETKVRMERRRLKRWCSHEEGYGFPVKE